MSLRRQFAVVLATFALAIAVVFGTVTWRIASDALEAELDRRLVQIPRSAIAVGGFSPDIIASYGQGSESSSSYRSGRSRLDSLSTLGTEAFVFQAVDGGYRSLLTADSLIPVGASLSQLSIYATEINEAQENGFSTTPVFPDENGSLVKYGFVQLDPVAYPDLLMAVLISAELFNEPILRLARALLLGTLISLTFAVLVAALLARNIANPLERLSRVAIRIQRGHMKREVEVERGDEVGRLSRAMERMRLGVLERDEQLRLMLAQVAHEIRNPLGGLELFAAAAAETQDVEERHQLMARIRGEVEALNQIIDDFLAFARPVPREQAAVDIRSPVRDAADLAQGQLEAAGKALSLEISEEPLLAVTDDDRLKRAVLNLLRNAGDAAQREVSLRAGLRGSEIEIAVGDDGPGVSPEVGDRVFEPFFTDKEKGAGLGLAIVRKFVESGGGRVEWGNADGGDAGTGAEFRIYFPGLEEPPLERGLLDRTL